MEGAAVSERLLGVFPPPGRVEGLGVSAGPVLSRVVGPVVLLFAGVLLFPRDSGPDRAGELFSPPEGRGEALPCERLLLFAPLFPDGEGDGDEAGLLGGFVIGGDGLDPETLIHQPLQTQCNQSTYG